MNCSSLIPIVGISKAMQTKLQNKLHIYDVRTLLNKGYTQKKRVAIATTLNVDERLVYAWVKQASLWQVDGMTDDMAYLLVQAGVRGVEDLAKVSVEKIAPILRALEACQVDFVLVDEAALGAMIANAKALCSMSEDVELYTQIRELKKLMRHRTNTVKIGSNTIHANNIRGTDSSEQRLDRLLTNLEERSNSAYQGTLAYIEHTDPVPTHLFCDEAIDGAEPLAQGMAEIRTEMKNLLGIGFSLPLPRLLVGKVVFPGSAQNVCSGFRVEVEGVVSASTDKDESDKNPCCTTDSQGQFVIVLPERYSFKEVVKLLVTEPKMGSIEGRRQEYLMTVADIVSATKKNFDTYVQDHDSKIDQAWSALLEDKVQELKDRVRQKREWMGFTYPLRGTESMVWDSATKQQELERKKELQAKADNGTISELEQQELTMENYMCDLQEDYARFKETFKDYFRNTYAYNLYIEENKYLTAQIEPRVFVVSEEEEKEDKKSGRKLSFVFSGDYTEEEHAKAMPKVKLMDNGDEPVLLSTDTAPSKVYNYCMLQRLVEPKLYPAGTERQKLNRPVSLTQFKDKLCTDPQTFPQMGTLGVGYVLNMHQAWVPDGFALGSLLYSLILAPGEEQRIVVRENKQSYEMQDTAEAIDSDTQEYTTTQNDDTDTAYQYALDQLSQGNSQSEYYAKTTSHGWSVGASGGKPGVFGLSAGYSGSTSTSKGNASASASQHNSHDEASSAAQSFQQAIQTASNRISKAKRISISTATDVQSDSVSTKIIANHNHSHSMTVQYWEVMRRYRLETAVDGVDLVLFVPMELVQFLPKNASLNLNLQKDTNRSGFENTFYTRYETVYKHFDTLYQALPSKYRKGLNLMKSYWCKPYWALESKEHSLDKVEFSFVSNLCSRDNITVTLVLKNGKGRLVDHPDYGKEKLYGFDELGENYIRSRDLKEEMASKRTRAERVTVKSTFVLPAGVYEDDVSHIQIDYSCDELKIPLKFHEFDPEVTDNGKMKGMHSEQYYVDHGFNQAEAKAAIKMADAYWDYICDNNDSDKDMVNYHHYMEATPECLSNYPFRKEIAFNTNEMLKLGSFVMDDITITGGNLQAVAATDRMQKSVKIPVSTELTTMKLHEVQEIESTFTHIITNGLQYSQALWASMTSDERAMLLEQYLVDVEELDRTPNQTAEIPLLNCIDVKKVIGFYGNCMLFPFTFPKELADDLGVTAAELQNSLYAYHTNSFRAPTTTISLPTDGMIGEAVLGQTNVSEKIDLTRFWNWKDSDIDHMELDSSYLNGTDYLAGKTTKDVSTLNVQGATATAPVTVPDLISALVNKQTPTFDNITGLSEITSILNQATNSAAEGRNKALEQSNEAAKTAVSAMKVASDYDTEQKKIEAQTEQKRIDAETERQKNSNGISQNRNQGDLQNQEDAQQQVQEPIDHPMMDDDEDDDIIDGEEAAEETASEVKGIFQMVANGLKNGNSTVDIFREITGDQDATEETINLLAEQFVADNGINVENFSEAVMAVVEAMM